MRQQDPSHVGLPAQAHLVHQQVEHRGEPCGAPQQLRGSSIPLPPYRPRAPAPPLTLAAAVIIRLLTGPISSTAHPHSRVVHPLSWVVGAQQKVREGGGEGVNCRGRGVEGSQSSGRASAELEGKGGEGKRENKKRGDT